MVGIYYIFRRIITWDYLCQHRSGLLFWFCDYCEFASFVLSLLSVELSCLKVVIVIYCLPITKSESECNDLDVTRSIEIQLLLSNLGESPLPSSS